MKPLLFLIAVSFVAQATHAQFVLFPYSNADGSAQNAIDEVPGFGNITEISDACQAALNSTINCDPAIQRLAAASYYGSMNASGQILCTLECGSSLTQYHTNVAGACTDGPIYDGVSNSWRGDILWSFYNISCQSDPSSGVYCPDFLINQLSMYGQSDPLDLPVNVLCTPCQLGLWRSMQASGYAGYDSYAAATWTSIQQKCNVSYPVEPPPPALNVTLLNLANGTINASTTCISGNYYKVAKGDTCQSIALANSVNSGTLKILNSIFPDCSNIAVGQSLCLPQTCETYLMTPNDTCVSVSLANNISVPVFIGYNPTINSLCSNLDLNGTVVCITPAAGVYTPTTVAGAVPTQTATYADDPVPPPGSIAFNTTLNCGKWYQVNPGDYCSIISVSNGITLDLLLLTNPSIDSACDNLFPGLYYCVQPTYNWNITNSTSYTSEMPVNAPGPTPSGSVSTCFRWHKIVANDTCSLLEASYGITFADLVAWNPSLDSNCFNLVLKDYYCVNGPSMAVSTTSGSTTADLTSPTVGSSTTSSNPTMTPTPVCTQTYVALPGDTCSKIWTQFDITEAQFRAYNPSLDANCDIKAGQTLCVAVSGPTRPILARRWRATH